MTKSLTNKLKKTIVTGVIGAASLLGINSNEAYSQDSRKVEFKEGQKVQVKDPYGGLIDASVLNIHGTYYFEVPQEDNSSDLWVAATCPRSYSYGNEKPTYTQGLVLKKANANFEKESTGEGEAGGEKRVGEIYLTTGGPLGMTGEKMQDLIEKEKTNLGTSRLDDNGRVTGIHTIDIEDKAKFVPYMNDETIGKLKLDGETKPEEVASFITLPVKDQQEIWTDQNISPYGAVSLMNKEDGIIYVVDKEDSKSAYLHPDSLTKFLRVYGYPQSWNGELKQTGEAISFDEGIDKEPAGEQTEEKSKKRIFSLNVEGGYDFVGMKGFEGRIIPQFKVGENFTLGPYVEYSTAERTTQNNLQVGDSVSQLPNTNLYLSLENRGTNDKKNITNTWGAGIQTYADYDRFRVGFALGVQNQTLDQILQSSGDIKILDANQSTLNQDAYADENKYSSSALGLKGSISADAYLIKGLYAGVYASGVWTGLEGTSKVPEFQKVNHTGLIGAKLGYTLGKTSSEKKDKVQK